MVIFAAASTVFNVMGPKVMGHATTELAEGLMRKIGGTGGIDFDKIAQILPIYTGALFGQRRIYLRSGLDYDRRDAENLLSHAQGNIREDQPHADEVFLRAELMVKCFPGLPTMWIPLGRD